MPLFNWFSRKSDRNAASRQGARGAHERGSAASPSSPLPGADPGSRVETRKAKRHARREQLYVAVREAMTRAGVLASSYKFKVLSLDQQGNQFLVMMDVAPALGQQPEKLAETETLIVYTAKARFEIFVTAVYWRTDLTAVAGLIKPRAPGPGQMAAAPEATVIASKKPPLPRYEPIQEDEVAAFKQALATASAANPTSSVMGKSRRSGLHSYTLLTGFEDTEMPESGAAPALSTTQYGDLN